MAELKMKAAVITARREALEFLASHDVTEFACCGPLDESTGQCPHRAAHATPAYESMLSYPEAYDADGHYIWKLRRS